MAPKGNESSKVTQSAVNRITTNLNQTSICPVFPRRSQQTFHHVDPLPFRFSIPFLLTLILSVVTSVATTNGLEYDEQFLEELPLQAIVSTGTDTSLYTSEDFTRTCFTKIDYRTMCAQYGPACEFKFEWSYPESLLELIKKGFDARIRVQDDLPVRLKSNSDYEVYASHLIVSNVGYSHQGIWSCNFKFINQDNGKLDSWQHIFDLQIKENGARGSPCLTNDHCSSFTCSGERCVCDAEEPIAVNGQCKKAPKLGEACTVNSECEKTIDDATCLFSSSASANSSESTASDPGKFTCQCPPSYVVVSLGLGSHRCLKKARIDEHCYRSAQCEAIDVNTYCSFKNRCSCRSGKSCTNPSIRTCTTKSDCNSANEYCGNGRCQVVKDLNEACSSNDECEPFAVCSTSRKQCICSEGYKISPLKMTCIPEAYCYNDFDCDHGYCDSEKSTCVPGVKLLGYCNSTKQCQAYDENSHCDGDSNQCSCGAGYSISSQSICLLNGKCRVSADCREDENGNCYYGECIYTRKLGSKCRESRQCFLQTSYSFCDDTGTSSDDQSKCSCLNGFKDNQDFPLAIHDPEDDGHEDDHDGIHAMSNRECSPFRKCEKETDCGSIINSHCDTSKSICACLNGYNLNIDGFCYKKSLSPASEKDSFWIKLWNDYYLYIIVIAALSGFIISLIICCCFKLCQKSHRNEEGDTRRGRGKTYPRRTREGHERPVTGIYIPHSPSAPPPPYQEVAPPSTISRNF